MLFNSKNKLNNKLNGKSIDITSLSQTELKSLRADIDAKLNSIQCGEDHKVFIQKVLDLLKHGVTYQVGNINSISVIGKSSDVTAQLEALYDPWEGGEKLIIDTTNQIYIYFGNPVLRLCKDIYHEDGGRDDGEHEFRTIITFLKDLGVKQDDINTSVEFQSIIKYFHERIQEASKDSAEVKSLVYEIYSGESKG